MPAIDYQGIRDQLESIITSDTRTSDARVYVEEEPQFGLQDVQKSILIYMDRRTAPPQRQVLASGKKVTYFVQVLFVIAFFSLESYRAACDGRDALLGQLELVLMANPTIGGKVNSCWLEGGAMYSAKDAQSSTFVAVAETTLSVDVTAVNT